MKYNRFFWNTITFHVLLVIICIAFSSLAQVQKRNYAMIGIKNAEGVSTGEAEIIADRLRIELFNTGMTNMMERDRMQDILSEQGFQQSGVCTDEACMVEIGQLLGVERLVSGSIGKLGSMFLLNFRSIDVQTAKIIKVVSVDISGGIEDVVKHLPNIAQQLVGEEVAKKPKKKAAKKKAPEPEPEVVKEEPAVPVPVPVPEKEPEKPSTVTVSKDKNENRSGIRLSFNWFPGGMTPYFYDSFEANDYVENELMDMYEDLIDSLDNEDYWTGGYTKFCMRLQVSFMIKAGPFIVIDIGPGMMVMNQYYELDYDDYVDYSEEKVQFTIVSPHITTGVSFVKRFYPLKINAGFLFDLNFNTVRYTYEFSNSSGVSDSERDNAFSVNVSFGPRVGLEILGGQHFGFSVDFLYRYSMAKAAIQIFGYEDEKWKYKLPGIGLGAGFNFYF